MQSEEPRTAFTLRFRRRATHLQLRLTAELLGVSMNELAEAAIERHLERVGVDLERRLERCADLLRDWRAGTQDLVDEFVEAEVTEEDPLQARLAVPEDKLGIGAIFAGRMGPR